MKIREKSPICLNCHHQLDENDNFCSKCGQENDSKNKKIGTFLKDFFDDLTSIDSRLWRSIPPFLFKAGKLTQDYNAGKRKTYVTPIRLYLTFSLLYFFVIAWIASIEGQKIEYNLKDKNKKKKINIFDVSIEVEKAQKLFNQKLTQKQILDSLHLKNSYFNYLFVKQAVKLNNSSVQELSNYFIGKIPIVMFILLPIFALLLKLFYIFSKRRYFYIEHLIFTLHIHAFAFFILTIAAIFNFIFKDLEWIYFFASIWIILHIFIALKSVYKQNILLTFSKFFCITILYSFVLVIGILVGIIISFMLF